MVRKMRVDSAEALVATMQAATKEIVPPEHVPLEDDDMPFWHSVIGEFARIEWTDHQLELAAMLARTMADLTREMQDLRTEGSILITEKGTPVVNPRKSIVQMNAATILSFRRSLAMHAIGKTPDSRNIADRRKATKDTEQDLDANGNPLQDDDDLINTPTHGSA